jgi:hypothetical protein
LLDCPEREFVVALLEPGVVKGERGPLAVASESRTVTFGEEPLKAAQRTRKRLALDQE